MSDEAKMQEHPTLPTTRPANSLEAAAYAVAARTTRGRHSQLCPVWVRRATIDACDCWILPRARTDASIAIHTAIAYDLQQQATC